MATIISKPYAVISEEWAEICDTLREAQSVLYGTQNPMFLRFPSDEQWQEYLAASEAYENAKKEFEEYRNTVRVAD